MRNQAALLLLVALPMFSGCYRAQIRNDGNSVRRALLDMYTDQAMDNLIQAYNNMPFVQLNYHDLQVQSTDQYTGTFTNNQTFAANRSLTFINLAASAMRTVGTAFSFGGTAQRQDLLSFKADPITDQDDIYSRYRDFARDPNRFRVSPGPPQEPVHLQRKIAGCYYYVPCSAAEDFMELILATTLQRGFNAASATYPVTVQYATEIPVPPAGAAGFIAGAAGAAVMSRPPSAPAAGGFVKATINFMTKVPNGDGLLIVSLPSQSGRTVRIQLSSIPRGEEYPGGPHNDVPNGQLIDHLRGEWNQSKEGFGPLDLKYAKGQFFSIDYPPPFTSIDTTLKRVNNNLETIRANTSIITLKPPLSP